MLSMRICARRASVRVGWGLALEGDLTFPRRDSFFMPKGLLKRRRMAHLIRAAPSLTEEPVADRKASGHGGAAALRPGASKASPAARASRGGRRAIPGKRTGRPSFVKPPLKRR